MPLTTADLESLDSAIATGELTVKVEGREVTYRSVSELLRAREHVRGQIAAAQPGAHTTGPFRFRFTTLRGD